MRASKLFVILLAFVIAAMAADGDWPQWRGPGRTGVSNETGLLKEWPKAGPPMIWSIMGLGQGYGTVAIQGDRIYIQGTQGTESVVFCLNRADGRLYLLSENNTVGLAEANPSGYAERGRFAIPDQGRNSWAHAVICGAKLYIRNQGVLACYDIKGK